jgi:hypothetical protein
MKPQLLSGLSRYLLPSIALISTALLLIGCGSGSTGSTGPPGPSGTSSGTVSGTVNNSISGTPVAGVAVTTSPSVQGVANIATDASGNYSVSLPIGSYTLTFTKNNYTTQTSTLTVVAAQTTTKNISLVPVASAVVSAGADQTGKTPGAVVSLSASLEIYDSTLTGTPTYAWTQTAGPTATISSSTSATTSVTLPNLKAYKDKIVEASGVYMGSKDAQGNAIKEPLDRLMVQSVVPLALEEADTATFKVTVTIGSRTFTDTVNVVASLPFFETLGVRNVPVNVPLILHGKTQGSYNWTVTSIPAGSQLTEVTDSTSQNPHFTPDVAGKFTITEATLGSIDVFAGTWTGALNQFGTIDSACQGCHNGGTAPDKFTPWFASGHAEIFKDNFNLGSAGHYGTSCFLCHTVGWNPNASNNGYDDQATYAAFLDEYFPGGNPTGGSTNWATITATGSPYGELVRRANAQCENCHGPQNSAAHSNSAARTSISSDACGVCHGEPLRHARFQQWAGSGHGNFEVAIAEGISSGAVRSTCAGCHSGQGFLQWYKQLANEGGGRGVGSRTLDATSLASLTGVNADNIQPQTCAVCHDPHAEGTTSGEPNNATVRVSGNTSLLPGGFMANGVGRGAVCITCHNSRNGERTSGGGNPTLHEDGDTNFGTNTAYTTVSVGPYAGEHVAYAAPHEAAQGDVLMGRNAYFVTGLRSRHSFIADTCATCHMELTPPPAQLSYQLAGTNHSFKGSKTICTQCHGTFDGGTIQVAFDTKLAELATEITNAVYKLRNGGAATPPATFVLSFGRSFMYSTDGGTTYANVGSSYSSSTGARTDGYLTDVTDGGTVAVDGYNAVIAKANWNYSLISVDSSKGIHNQSFTFEVLDQTISQVKALVASLP